MADVPQLQSERFISIHAPPRGATQLPDAKSYGYGFQFTPLREGRPTAELIDEVLEKFQFTPLREGRRAVSQMVANLLISIHAPPRGATSNCRRLVHLVLISIHAPPRGATRSTWRFPRLLRPFQFTPLREGRQLHGNVITNIKLFQFTPLREGRPGSQRRERGRTANFNSRPSARGDSKRYAISANLLFNPYKSAWLNNRARQFVEIILVIFHRIIA